MKDFICLSRKKKPKLTFYKIRHEIYINGHQNRMDTVFFVKVPNEKKMQTIGIEIKGHRNNLLRDMKMYNYLGHTDYFFLAVPPVLVKPARIKAAVDPRMGLIRMSDGKILIFPEKQDVPPAFRDEVINNALSSKRRSTMCAVCNVP